MYLNAATAIACFLFINAARASEVDVLGCKISQEMMKDGSIFHKYNEEFKRVIGSNTPPANPSEDASELRGKLITEMFKNTDNSLAEIGRLAQHCKLIVKPGNEIDRNTIFSDDSEAEDEADKRIKKWNLSGCGDRPEDCLNSLLLLSKMSENEFEEKCEESVLVDIPNKKKLDGKDWKLGEIACLIAGESNNPVPLRILTEWDSFWDAGLSNLDYLKPTVLYFQEATCAPEFFKAYSNGKLNRDNLAPGTLQYCRGGPLKKFIKDFEPILHPSEKDAHFGYGRHITHDVISNQQWLEMQKPSGICGTFKQKETEIPSLMRFYLEKALECSTVVPGEKGSRSSSSIDSSSGSDSDSGPDNKIAQLEAELGAATKAAEESSDDVEKKRIEAEAKGLAFHKADQDLKAAERELSAVEASSDPDTKNAATEKVRLAQKATDKAKEENNGAITAFSQAQQKLADERTAAEKAKKELEEARAQSKVEIVNGSNLETNSDSGSGSDSESGSIFDLDSEPESEPKNPPGQQGQGSNAPPQSQQTQAAPSPKNIAEFLTDIKEIGPLEAQTLLQSEKNYLMDHYKVSKKHFDLAKKVETKALENYDDKKALAGKSGPTSEAEAEAKEKAAIAEFAKEIAILTKNWKELEVKNDEAELNLVDAKIKLLELHFRDKNKEIPLEMFQKIEKLKASAKEVNEKMRIAEYQYDKRRYDLKGSNPTKLEKALELLRGLEAASQPVRQPAQTKSRVSSQVTKQAKIPGPKRKTSTTQSEAQKKAAEAKGSETKTGSNPSDAEKARLEAEAAEQARKAADEEAQRKAEEQARLEAEAATATAKAEEQARKAAADEAQRKAEEQARLEAEAATATAKAEEQARLEAEAAAATAKAEEQARLEAEAAAATAKAEEQARKAADEEAQRKAAEKTRLEAEAAAAAAKKLHQRALALDINDSKKCEFIVAELLTRFESHKAENEALVHGFNIKLSDLETKILQMDEKRGGTALESMDDAFKIEYEKLQHQKSTLEKSISGGKREIAEANVMLKKVKDTYGPRPTTSGDTTCYKAGEELVNSLKATIPQPA